jgi:SAM-dependent methyltransferase
MQHASSSHEPVHRGSSPEFDEHAAGYAAGMENRWKQLAGADAEVFIELKAWHLQEDLRRRPLAGGGAQIRLLDFGCGDGVLLRVLAATGFTGSLWGSDVSPRMLQEARDKWDAFTAAHPALQVPEPAWTVSRPGELPFETGSFDMVTCLGVIHHIAPADRGYEWSEIARVLRPGGRCYVYEHNPYNPLTQWVVRHTAIDENAILISQRETTRALIDHGFKATLAHGLMYWPPRWRRLWSAERWMRWIPFGGQYVVCGERLP